MTRCEHDLFAVIGAILGFLATCLAGVFILGASPDVPWLTLLQAAGPLVIAVGAVVAYMNYRQGVQKARRDEEVRKSKSYLDEAIGTLERSFELLVDGEECPPNDRLSWLSTARTLLAYEEIMRLVSEDDHKVILSEREEYWKKRFFDALHDRITGFDADYFRGKSSTGTTNNPPLALDSVAVVYGFCNWPKSKPDRMAEVDAVARFLEDTTVLHVNRGMGHWLETDHPKFWHSYQQGKSK